MDSWHPFRSSLGPMLRYTDETCAAIWVETDTDAEVSVHAGDREWRSRTFAVHGHHYALVEIEDLAPGSVIPYEVRVNGLKVWPEADSSLPAPVIATRSPGQPSADGVGIVPHECEP